MDNRTDLISIRVNRVVSRDVKTDHFMEPGEFERLLLADDNFETDSIGKQFVDKWRRLPKSLSQIFLGETFCFSIMVVNDSVTEPVKDVSVKIDLQFANDRMINIGFLKSPLLDSKQSLDEIKHYEIKDLGSHVLIFSISYRTVTDEPHIFRKYFKFQVEKPLDVKTKFYNAESDEVYLEALLQNLTNLPICLERVTLEPSQYFNVKGLNKVTIDGEEQWVFGKINRFNPMESRQYLFCLTPKPEVKANLKLLRSVTVIGRLDIVWISGIAVPGHLQTSPLERMAPNYVDIRLTIEGIPSQAELRHKFNITFRITNYCDFDIEPALIFDNKDEKQAILWLGVSGKVLDRISPHQCYDFTLTAYPIDTGLQAIPKVKISDTLSKNFYEFDEMAYVFINDPKSV
ncbi:trafficking protein particle complex subunit 13 [Tetranychus urticae]|uniref:Trafficking protein particle complex subunit 13 n=1 Tax=Tetranychus urticae TaxID=32264 RepID=T1KDU6_TETUR|nr:trafficking protein particle complex subunit 13 [Tetranychus urticae]